MTISWLSLFWLFFFYSFIGWCIEVCAAAVQHRKFVNRGFVAGPLCPIYGFGAVLFEIFLPELTEYPFFLFLGGCVLASLLEYSTGMFFEKVYKKKLWDYSRFRYNVGGYICLPFSLLWGALSVVTVMFADSLLCGLFDRIPHLLSIILLLILGGLLLLDTIGSALSTISLQLQAKHRADYALEKQTARLDQITEGLGETSRFLENALTRHMQKRLQKSYPAISLDALVKARAERKKSTVFAEGCCFYKLFSLFFIGAFLGDITETIFCRITAGVWMSRSSVIYGPFSIVWGLGCAFLTLLLYRYRNKSDGSIFVAGTLLGGAYEYICSVFTEMVFDTIFWDYSGFAFNLGGRINLLYCFFWGIAAVVWLKFIYPKLSDWIEKIPKKTGTIICNILIVFMIANMLISALALARYTERNDVSYSVETTELNGLQKFLDERYPDARMERIYPNAKMVD